MKRSEQQEENHLLIGDLRTYLVSRNLRNGQGKEAPGKWPNVSKRKGCELNYLANSFRSSML